ncbi:unnamed protein product [Schistosoma mattheei]|uniref:Uncharacterized protein n=1 Tax=Schistosoma mattheei TaxID=31246 RepID=A0A3P8J9G9_9TREM|nr:unnamed protein product [Schistosoma mattheei]
MLNLRRDFAPNCHLTDYRLSWSQCLRLHPLLVLGYPEISVANDSFLRVPTPDWKSLGHSYEPSPAS